MADSPEPQDTPEVEPDDVPRETPPAGSIQPSAGWAGPLGLVALVLLVVALGWLMFNRIQGAEFKVVDTVLLIVAGVAAAGAGFAYRDHLKSRGTLLSLNALVTTVAVLGILVLVNVIVGRRLSYIKADWTAGKFYSLSEQTANLVRGLKPDQAIELIAIVPVLDDFANQQNLAQQKRMLAEYGRLSDKVTVKTLDPNLDAEAAELLQSGVLTAIPGTVIRFKDRPEQREGVTGLDEQSITQGILKLLDPGSRKLYFVTGHGELERQATDRSGLSQLQQMLEKDRYEVADLPLLTAPEVPADAAALIIAYPQKPFSDEELGKLRDYLSRTRGGRLLAMLDPSAETNLGTLTAEFGIVYHDELVNDPTATIAVGGDATVFGSSDFADHETTKLFAGRYMTVFLRAGRLTQGAAADYELTDLIKTTSGAYAESKTPAPAPVEGEEVTADTPVDRTYGPHTLAMIATTRDPDPPGDDDEAQPEEDPNQKRVRVAVVADGEFASDALTQFVNLDVTANIVAWLTDNSKTIGIRAKDPASDLESRKITLDRKGRIWVTLLTLALPLLLVCAAGIAVQIIRR